MYTSMTVSPQSVPAYHPQNFLHPSLPSLIIPKQPWLLCIFQRFIYIKIILHVLILVWFPAISIIILTFTRMYNTFHFVAEWDPTVWAEHNLFIH